MGVGARNATCTRSIVDDSGRPEGGGAQRASGRAQMAAPRVIAAAAWMCTIGEVGWFAYIHMEWGNGEECWSRTHPHTDMSVNARQ